MSTQQQLDKLVQDYISLQSTLYELIEERDNLNSRITAIHTKIESISVKVAKIKANEFKETNNIDWKYLIKASIDNYELSKYFNRLLEDRTGYVLSADSYYPEINEKAFRISFMYVKEEILTEEYLKDLESFMLELCTFRSDKFKYDFRIMEPSLSEFGIYSLNKIKDKWTIVITRYSRDENVKSFNTLFEALVYIKDNMRNET